MFSPTIEPRNGVPNPLPEPKLALVPKRAEEIANKGRRAFWYAVLFWFVIAIILSVIQGLLVPLPLPALYQGKGDGPLNYYDPPNAAIAYFVSYFFLGLVRNVEIFSYINYWLPLLTGPICVIPLIMLLLRWNNWYLLVKIDNWFSSPVKR